MIGLVKRVRELKEEKEILEQFLKVKQNVSLVLSCFKAILGPG